MFGINKLHKYAGPKNFLLVDKNGDFQEINESVYDAIYEQYSKGYAFKLDIIRGRTGLHVFFIDLINDDSWPVATTLYEEKGWQAKTIKNLPEQCKLSSEAKAELIDRLDWYESITFFIL
jgi:hypothetical protein